MGIVQAKSESPYGTPAFELWSGNGRTHWLDDTFQLPLEADYSFTIHDSRHEMIGVFSQEAGEWGSGSDGLSWYHASHRSDFMMRTDIFKYFPRCKRHMDPIFFLPGRRYDAKIEIDVNKATSWVSGEPYYTCYFKNGAIKSMGKIGFTSYSGIGSSTIHTFEVVKSGNPKVEVEVDDVKHEFEVTLGDTLRFQNMIRMYEMIYDKPCDCSVEIAKVDGIDDELFPTFAKIDPITNHLIFAPKKTSHEAGEYFFKIVIRDDLQVEPVFDEHYSVTVVEPTFTDWIIQLLNFW